MAAPQPLSTPSTSAPEADWTDQVTDLIVDVVDRVHDRTTGPLIGVARWAVYGLLAVLVTTGIMILGVILVGRIMGLLLGEWLWAFYLGLGAVLCLGGLVLWSKRPVAGS